MRPDVVSFIRSYVLRLRICFDAFSVSSNVSALLRPKSVTNAGLFPAAFRYAVALPGGEVQQHYLHHFMSAVAFLSCRAVSTAPAIVATESARKIPRKPPAAVSVCAAALMPAKNTGAANCPIAVPRFTVAMTCPLNAAGAASAAPAINAGMIVPSARPTRKIPR